VFLTWRASITPNRRSWPEIFLRGFVGQGNPLLAVSAIPPDVVGIPIPAEKKHRKHHGPVKGKGFRKLFRKAGFTVFLVDEYRTSCRCSVCGGETKRFRICENPRPFRSGSIVRHGLVKCNTCNRLWNRDTNAASNIWKAATSALRGEGRPEYLRRGKRPMSDATFQVAPDASDECGA